MAKSEIFAGVCGFSTRVEAVKNEDYSVVLKITSECKDIQKLAEEIPEVNAFEQISFRRGVPTVLEKAQKYCSHASCPVPAGIIKTVEVAAGLALPADVSIRIEK